MGVWKINCTSKYIIEIRVGLPFQHWYMFIYNYTYTNIYIYIYMKRYLPFFCNSTSFDAILSPNLISEQELNNSQPNVPSWEIL